MLKDDLLKINTTLTEMKLRLGSLHNRYVIILMVITSKNIVIHPADEEYAKGNICILTQTEIDKILEMLKTRRNDKELIKYIEMKLF